MSIRGKNLLAERWQGLLLLGFLCLLYIPYTGNYGLWDPWETHYGEVARQMVERGDYISLWWPGSPQDGSTFWSKPVLTFWLMALSMKIFGLGRSGVAYADEMVKDWSAEWALRLPFVFLGILGVLAVWHLTSRLVGRRAALLSSLILATSTQWALITRQAMTDMAFVTPMTLAVAFAGLALILPEMRAPLTRRSRRILGREISWPHHPLFYGFLALYCLCAVPQLVTFCVQLTSFTFQLGGRTYRTAGIVAMLPFLVLFPASLWLIAGVRDRRSIYLFLAYLMGALATLAKGPAGIGFPVITLLLFLLCAGRLGEMIGQRRTSLLDHDGLEIVRGALIFLCAGAPWWVAMLARHGAPFWMEMIGDNYVHRAQGRHGDRGTFEYYIRQLGLGMFPWSGVVAAAAFSSGRWLSERTPRQKLVLLCLAWFIVDFVVVSLVNTKFHHYILPALPALAILGGLLLDELIGCGRGARQAGAGVLALSLLGLLLTWLSGRDMAKFPARIGWLFNYDYVNAPGGGRPWPLVSIYGQRYEYGTQVLGYALAALAATALLALLSARLLQEDEGGLVLDEDPPPGATLTAPGEARPLALLVGAILLAGLLAAGILIAPSLSDVAHWSSSARPADTVLPPWMRLGYLVPALSAAAWLACALLKVQGASPSRGAPLLATLLLGGVATLWTCFVLDRFLIDISPHWSQKSVFGAYYRLRKGPEEPVIAWFMYWRGENFYTRNQIYDHRLDPGEKTVFLGDKNAEKMQAYFASHRGKKVFFLLERSRLETLRGLLPQECRASLKVVDESNNKVYLAEAQL